jgi:predicted 3-demethylubiquinone-9 3-methyltransferase (glyoxalase superfamily)
VKTLTTSLWFDTQAEEAAQFYASLFPDSKVGRAARYGPAGPGPEGTVMTVAFTLVGRDFIGINGGPQFPFTEAVSFVVNCENQDEVDFYWDKLAEGGQHGVCGWLKDKYGLSWQVVPTVLAELMTDRDPEAARRTTEAMLSMTKLVIADLQRAHDGA